MALRIFLFRHGETLWNRDGRTQGRSDVELSSKGWEQAQGMAQALAKEPLAAVYASSLQRSRVTAEKIAESHGLPVHVDERLCELNQGDLEGLDFATIRARHPEFIANWRATPGQVRMPGGESLVELQERVWGFVDELLRRHNHQETVAVVAHNFINIAIICKVLGLPLDSFRRVRQDTAARNIIEFGEQGPVLVTLNETAYLHLGQ
ncbi:MAG: histidine phosphatase family protein [Chloroflexi bacterium]|nr:histidine phosphatase family protein [Chloroflexota bacterium]